MCPEEQCQRHTFNCSLFEDESGACGLIPQGAQGCQKNLETNCGNSSGGGGGGGSSPPPSSGGGTWGACGSCSTCGFTASQCVLDPYGNCVWDPGRCTGSGPGCNWSNEQEAAGTCRGTSTPYYENPVPCCSPLIDKGTNHCHCPTCGDGYCTAAAGENSNTCKPDCCVASCTGAMCGQQNGCGGYCPSTDSGAPGSITLNPSNGGTVTISGSTATVQWSAATKADSYIIDLYPSDSNCTAYPTHCNRTVVGTSYTFTPDSGKNQYTYSVRAVNTSCGYQTGAASGPATFTIMAEITGAFFEDPGQAAEMSGGNCTLPGATSTSPGTGAAISAVGSTGSTYNGTIQPGNWFRILVPYWPNGNNVVTHTPGSSGGVTFTCTCPEGCTYSGIASPQAAVRFFILPEDQITDNWWQVWSGNAYAGATSGTTAYSPTPDEANCNSGTNCRPYISANDADDTSLSAGLVITGGGDIDSQRETGNQATFVSQQSPQLYVTGTSTSRFQEKYSYFYRKFTFENFVDNGSTPAGLANGQAYFYDGDLTLDDPWTVAADQQVIIFVDGNLTFSDPTNANQLMVVEDGGFLAFIVSGNITIDESLGNETLDSAATNLEGIYIADGTMTVASRGSAAGGDDRFVGAGSFIGWGGVALERDFSSDADTSRLQESKTNPSELFIFRPDLVRNIPEAMTSPRYIWQETN
ncbi:MAG TPA: fibronectin type III domain-containing protein [Patescibacteria group bacterium]